MDRDPEVLYNIAKAYKAIEGLDYFSNLGIKSFLNIYLELLDEATRLDKRNNPRIFVILGDGFSKAGKHRLALWNYRKYFSLSKDLDIYKSLGRECLYLKRYGCAKRYFEEYIGSGKKDPIVLFELSKLSYREGKLTEALNYINEVISRDPFDRGKVFELKGDILSRLNKLNDAVRSYEMAIEHYKKDNLNTLNIRLFAIYMKLSSILENQKKYKEALKVLEEASRLGINVSYISNKIMDIKRRLR